MVNGVKLYPSSIFNKLRFKKKLVITQSFFNSVINRTKLVIMQTRQYLIKASIVFGQLCPRNLTKFQQCLYYTYGGTVFFLLHIMSVIFQFTLIIKLNSLQEAANVLFIAINSFLSSIKFSITHVYSKEFDALEAQLFAGEFLPGDKTERNIRTGYLTFYRQV